MEEEQEQIQKASLLQLMTWWQGDVPKGVYSSIRFRIAVGKVLCQSPEGAAFLKDQALYAEFSKRKDAVLHLNRAGLIDQEIIDSLRAAFKSPDPVSKYLALFCLRCIDQYVLDRGAVERLFYQLEPLQGELAINAQVELAVKAMEYLARAFPENATEILRIGLQSDIEGMRMSACHGVMNNEVYELLPEVEKLNNDSNEGVARSAKNVLYFLQLRRNLP